MIISSEYYIWRFFPTDLIHDMSCVFFCEEFDLFRRYESCKFVFFSNEIILHTYLPSSALELNLFTARFDSMLINFLNQKSRTNQTPLSARNPFGYQFEILSKITFSSFFQFYFRYINTDSSIHHWSIIKFDCKHFV